MCILITSFETRYHNAITRFFTLKSMTMASAVAIRGEYSPDGGVQCPVAPRVALDLPYWVMHLAPYRLIRMATEIARKAGACFSVVNFMTCITIAKRPCHGPFKINPSYTILFFTTTMFLFSSYIMAARQQQ